MHNAHDIQPFGHIFYFSFHLLLFAIFVECANHLIRRPWRMLAAIFTFSSENRASVNELSIRCARGASPYRSPLISMRSRCRRAHNHTQTHTHAKLMQKYSHSIVLIESNPDPILNTDSFFYLYNSIIIIVHSSSDVVKHNNTITVIVGVVVAVVVCCCVQVE